jgi:Kef-type K+ transport system membrane component KefB
MLPMLLSIGVLYLLAMGAGRLNSAVGIPRVTGYLAVGLAAGPSFTEILGLPALITINQLHALAPVHDIILGLIVFSIGGSFSLRTIRKTDRSSFASAHLKLVSLHFLLDSELPFWAHRQ